MTKSSKKSLKNEYIEIVKQAKKQPGVSELMKVYGRYDEFLTASQAYIGLLHNAESFSVSASSS